MIYSRWRPSGGYDYFQTREELPIGDDPSPMHVPNAAGNIGTPAQECGYLMPGNATYVGSGADPQGLISPTYFKASLGELGPDQPRLKLEPFPPYKVFITGLAVGGLVGCWWWWGR